MLFPGIIHSRIRHTFWLENCKFGFRLYPGESLRHISHSHRQPFPPFAYFFQYLFPWISLFAVLSNKHLQVLGCVGSSPSPPGINVNVWGLPSNLSHLLFPLRIHPRIVPFNSNETSTAPAPSHFCCPCSTPGFFSAILGVIIVPLWVSHVFEGRHKKKNKSFHSPTALICSWASWSFHPFAWVSPFSSSVPPNSLLNTCFSPQVAKCLACWGHIVSKQTADYSPNPVIYNLRSNTPPSNRQNIMLPLAPLNAHPCGEGNTPSLQEVPPKLPTLLAFLVTRLFSGKATT